MSLRYKTAIIIISLFLIITVSEFYILRYFVYDAFVTLEKNNAENDMLRITQALDNDISHLNKLNNDWATWNDTYSFVNTKSDKFIESNLPNYVFNEAGLDLIYIVDNSMNVVWGKIFDRYKQKEIEIDEIPKKTLPKDHPFIIRDYRKKHLNSVHKKGIFNTEKGPMLISTELILTSLGKGPPKGYMIMGIFLNENYINKVKEQTKEDFNFLYLYNSSEALKYNKILKQLEDNKLYIEDIDDNQEILKLYKFYKDIENNPSILIEARINRNVTIQGKKVVSFATLFLIITGITILISILLLINRYAINPLTILDKYMFNIINKDDFSLRLDSKRKDEIGDLSRAFDFFIGIIENQKKDLEKLSTIDGLTNIANRRKFDEVIKTEWERHKRFQSTIAVVLLDVDYFKLYNDFYGHQAGDSCLKAIGSILSKHAKRAGELVARYGGEEFVIMYCNTNIDSILESCKRLKKDIDEINIIHEKSQVSSHVTLSIGAALCIPDKNEDYKNLIEKADQALYKAKENGRNQTVLY